MERYAEEYDVAIVGGGPDILFFLSFFSIELDEQGEVKKRT
jgi:hypothetical protein